MNRSARAGFTIIETLVAMALLAILVASVVPLLTLSMRNNDNSRGRTSSSSVAESWLDRYRSGQEPTQAVGPCVNLASGVGVTCTYAKGFNYASDGIPSHSADAAKMNELFSPYATTITVTRITAGVNSQLWEIQAAVQAKAGTAGGSQRAVLTTRFTQ